MNEIYNFQNENKSNEERQALSLLVQQIIKDVSTQRNKYNSDQAAKDEYLNAKKQMNDLFDRVVKLIEEGAEYYYLPEEELPNFSLTEGGKYMVTENDVITFLRLFVLADAKITEEQDYIRKRLCYVCERILPK